MKKSTLLSLLTAGAVIATSAGTFAAWDTTEATAEMGTVEFKQVNVSAAVSATLTTTRNGIQNDLPEATGTFTVSTTNIDELGNTKLTFTPVVKEGDTTIDPSNYSVQIKDNGTDVTSGDSAVEASNTYTVTVKPTDAGTNAMANKNLKVDIITKLEVTNS